MPQPIDSTVWSGRVADPDRFTGLFTTFTATAYRLEVRRAYGVPDEDVPFQEYLAGRDPGTAWLRPWLELMARQTGMGKRVERVRFVDTPPSPYLRWEIHCTPHNLAAGEDIRYLPRPVARRLALPDHDYWLFDNALVAVLDFDAQDRFLGFRTTTDPAAVAQHLAWQRAAWRHALPHDRYRR